MYEIDRNAAYRLIDVLNADGRSKVNSRTLYQERVGCIATNIRVDDWPYIKDSFVVRMDFVVDANGNWTQLSLRTSPLYDILEADGALKIYTQNSIYVLEPAELPKYKYLDAANLIELHLNDSDYNFCKGAYYDAESKPHDLSCLVHLGTFQDSCLIRPVDDALFGEFACRYFPHFSGVEFYDTLYHQQDYSTQMLIHNTARQPLRIKFDRFPAVWTIQPGEAKYIMPYDATGADPVENG